MKKDLVSVIMPTYNDEKYLSSAIEDILNQTYENFEFIIVNDGSTDNTKEILEQYAKKDSRIRIFHKENGGTGSALNYGFRHAEGEFGTWVSSDDNKEERFIEVLVNFLKQNRDIECVYSTFESKYLGKLFKPYIFYDDKNIVRDPTGVHNDNTTTGKSFVADDWADMNSIQCFAGVCWMFTMRLKRKCGEYIGIPGEDYYMAMKMALNTRTGYIDEKLGTHNNPPDSLSVVNRNCVAEANMLTRKLYQENKRWNLRKIPKIASFYWGSNTMSFMRYLTIKSFKKYNPDWSIHLYRPKKLSLNKTWEENDNWHRQDCTDSKNENDYYEKLLSEEAIKVITVNFAKSPLGNEAPEVHKSDYLRWNILYKNGGLWSDMDIIYYKSVNNILQNTRNDDLDSIVCYDERHGGLAAIGFLLTSPGNIFYKNLSQKCKKLYDPQQYQSIGSDLYKATCPDINYMNNFFKIKTDNLSTNEVYFYDFKNLDKVYNKNNFEQLYEKSIGLHWYGGHPLSQEMNNVITENNFEEKQNTFTEAVKFVMKS